MAQAKRRKPKIDYDELQYALETQGMQSRLYKMIRAKMEELGHWKTKPRGKSFTFGFDRRRYK